MKRPPPRRGDTLDELLGQLALDDREGPALPLDAERARALVRRARERSAPGPASPGRLLRFPKLPLIGVGVVIATSAAAALGGFPRLLGLASSVDEPADVREAPPHEAHRSATKRARAPGTPEQPSPPAALSRPVDEPPIPVVGADARPSPSPTAPSPVVAPPVSAPSPRSVSRPAASERRESSGVSRMERSAVERSRLEGPQKAERSVSETRAPFRATSTRTSSRERGSSVGVAPELDLDDVKAPDMKAPDSAPAADLLGVANRARAERRFTVALDAYRRVIAGFPESRQAQIARVSAGDLELERGNSRAAEQLFYKALRDADVGAEALFGLSEAYRAEARVVEERRALLLFGQRHPSNPLAATARRRLSELDEAHAPK